MKKFSLVVLLSLLNFGCAMFAPKNFSEYTQGQWQGKVLVRDKVEKKTALVNIKVQAIDNQSLRIDVTSPVGAHVATIVMEPDSLTYLNVAEKTVYKSKPHRDSLKAFMRVPIEPQHLYNVFFDRAIDKKTWSCASNESGFLQSCKDRQTGLNIQWVSREGAKRTIAFEHTSATVQMNLFDFDKNIAHPQTAFVLKPPSSFKVKKM